MELAETKLDDNSSMKVITKRKISIIDKTKSRRKIYAMLYNTFFKFYKKSFIRHYKMTTEEYELSRPYIIRIFFSYNEESYEGYCFDTRTLFQEKYLKFNIENTGCVPIILSSQRWNYLVEREDTLALESSEPGILLFSLTKEEILRILECYTYNSNLCIVIFNNGNSKFESFKTIEKKINLSFYFDNSKSDRYGPKIITTTLFNTNKNEKTNINNNDNDINNKNDNYKGKKEKEEEKKTYIALEEDIVKELEQKKKEKYKAKVSAILLHVHNEFKNINMLELRIPSTKRLVKEEIDLFEPFLLQQFIERNKHKKNKDKEFTIYMIGIVIEKIFNLFLL